MVREAVPDETQLALLDVLLDGVERLLLGNLHLGVGPARHLDDHVEDRLGLVGKERNVVERRDDLAVALDVGAVLCGQGSERRQRRAPLKHDFNHSPKVLGA